MTIPRTMSGLFMFLDFMHPAWSSIWTLNRVQHEPCMGLNRDAAWISICHLHGSQPGHCMVPDLDPAWISTCALYGSPSGPCMGLNLDPASWLDPQRPRAQMGSGPCRTLDPGRRQVQDPCGRWALWVEPRCKIQIETHAGPMLGPMQVRG